MLLERNGKFTMWKSKSSNESVDGIYVELGLIFVVLMPNSFINVSI